MTKRKRTILILAVLLPVLVLSGSIGAYEFRRQSIQAGYDAIQLGDMRKRVVEMMGSPSEEEPCFKEPDCTSLYYYALFERWIVHVDSSDKVIHKVNNEGLF